MELDLLNLLLVCAGITIAVLVAVVAGTLAARLFFQASGLAREDASTRGEKPPR